MAYRTCLLVIGAGGMGTAIARRLGSGKLVIIADHSSETLNQAAQTLRGVGHLVETQLVDISSFDSVTSLAKFASAAGDLKTVVHTAGLSPAMAPAKRIFEVDLLGTANVIDAFLDVMPHGSTLTLIASVAGHMAAPSIPLELESHLATAPLGELLSHTAINLSASSVAAYGISKRGNILRAQAAAVREAGLKGVRVNTVSPGIIMTPMAVREFESETGEQMRRMVEVTPVKRAGTPDDIANAVAFLASPEACFVNGTDLLVDGGFAPTQRFGTDQGQ